MPEHALYYPEWLVDNPVFLAEALLYWDRLGCIVPFPEFRPVLQHEDAEMRRVMQEAHEQFITGIVPTEQQKQRAHKRIQAFAQHEPPDWCRPENLTPEHRTVFSAGKCAPETVNMLQQWGWSRPVEGRNRLEMQMIFDAAGYWVMGALADACSSPTMLPVTDDPDSFATSCNLLLRELGASTGITAKEIRPRQETRNEGNLAFLLAKVPHLSIKPADVNADVLRRILRSRCDSGVNEQRRAFQKKVDKYLEKLRTAEEPEQQLLADEFRDELRNDQESLNRELRRRGLETVFSKEGAVAVLLGFIIGVINPGIGIAIGLAGEAVNYHYKRQDAVNQHWSSWIFSATTNRLTVW